MLNAPSLAAVVAETAPLGAVAAMVKAGEYDAVIVLGAEDHEVLGVLFRDAILRLSPRLPEAPVRLLPLQKAGAVSPDLSVQEAESLLNRGEIDVVLMEQRSERSWSVLLRA